MNMPIISVIVPIYNSSMFLEKSVKSILNQTYTDFELILVDDGSKDYSLNVCEKYSEIDSKIKVLHKENGGPSSARNFGLENAKGKYICFVDSDDTIQNDYLESLVKGFAIDYIDVVCCGYYYDGKIKYMHNDFNENKAVQREAFVKGVLKGTGGTVWGKLYKKNIIDLNKIRFVEEFSMCEDILFNIDYASCISNCNSIDYFGYIYNDNTPESITNNLNLKQWKQQIKIVKLIEDKLKINLNFENLDGYLYVKCNNIAFNLLKTKSKIVNYKVFKDYFKNDIDFQYIKQKIKIESKHDIVYLLPLKLHLYRSMYLIYSKMVKK